MARRRCLTTQMGGVVDLAVAAQQVGAVGTRERLVSGGKVHDREAPGAEPCPRMADDALTVGSAMAQRLGHGGQALRVAQRRACPEGYRAEDAAHGLTPLLGKDHTRHSGPARRAEAHCSPTWLEWPRRRCG